MYKGVPLETGTVIFQPPSGPFVTGEIQPDGTFQLKGGIGENTVMIVSRESVDSTVNYQARVPPKSHIPEVYNSPRSGLTFEVQPGENTADFDLK